MGDEVTPAGRPENDTAIELENPFLAAADITDGGLVVPERAVSTAGPTKNAKSGGGGGGDVLVPPQPDSIVMRIATPSKATSRGVIRVIRLIPALIILSPVVPQLAVRIAGNLGTDRLVAKAIVFSHEVANTITGSKTFSKYLPSPVISGGDVVNA